MLLLCSCLPRNTKYKYVSRKIVRVSVIFPSFCTNFEDSIGQPLVTWHNYINIRPAKFTVTNECVSLLELDKTCPPPYNFLITEFNRSLMLLIGHTCSCLINLLAYFETTDHYCFLLEPLTANSLFSELTEPKTTTTQTQSFHNKVPTIFIVNYYITFLFTNLALEPFCQLSFHVNGNPLLRNKFNIFFSAFRFSTKY